jgi:hypothetical protein
MRLRERGADQAPDVATIGEVDGIVAPGVAEGIAGVEYVGVIEEDPGVAVRVCIVDIIELRLAAAHFHRLVNAAKKPSTAFIHEALVGVKGR